jgi:proteasome lid subunit RPN8/RPN11
MSVPAAIELPAHAVDEMAAHARETYPDECCGVLIGGADGSVHVARVRNVQDQMHAEDPQRYPRTARTAYSGHPGDLRVALERADAPGHRLLAFYHSHPDHDAYFSKEDMLQATPFGEPSYPDALQIVISIYERRLKEIKAFAWAPDEQTFAAVDLRASA